MSAVDTPQRGGLAALVDWWRERRTRFPIGTMTRPGTNATGAVGVSNADESGAIDTTALFARALREGSNLEQDWLWLSTIVTGEDQLRYCLKRALYINPQSKEAREELARLARRHRTRPSSGARACVEFAPAGREPAQEV